MLTLNFNGDVSSESSSIRRFHPKYYTNENDLHGMMFKFSLTAGETPFFMSANPSLHKRGLLHVSTNHPFGSRGLNMLKLKEILDNAPVGVRVKILSDEYIVAKGFIGKITSRDNISNLHDKVEIMFVVASETGKAIYSPHQLKIYLNRELYQPQYKRVMSLLKPYMSEHKGDIIVTNSINDYLVYQFKLPTLSSIQDRVKFNDNMKEFFFRSMKWVKWRKEQDAIIEKREQELKIKRAKDESLRLIQESTIAVLENEYARITVTTPVIEPDLVEEVLLGEQPAFNQERLSSRIEELVEHQVEMAASLREEIGIPADRFGEIPMNSDIQEEQLPFSPQQDQVMNSSQLHIQQPVQELSHGYNIQPQGLADIPDIQDIQETLLPSIPQQGEYVSPEEMQRIMNGFAIAQPIDIQYAVRLSPSTGLPITEEPSGIDDGLTITEMYIDETTEVVFEEDIEDEDDGTDHNYSFFEPPPPPTEEELDNDPNEYQEAEIVQ